MRKRTVVLMLLSVLAVLILPISSTVSAENSKAVEIREILNSKKYYVEYENENNFKVRGKLHSFSFPNALAVNGNKWMTYQASFKGSGGMGLPIPMIGGLFGGNKTKVSLQPEVFYDGNNHYYIFESKKEALMATGEQLKDPYINPMQGWTSINTDMKLPEAFDVFTNDDSIEFVESGSEIVDSKNKKEMAFDKYVKHFKSATGKVIYDEFYIVYYNEKNELAQIEMKNIAVDDELINAINKQSTTEQTNDANIATYVKPVVKILIKKFTTELPESAMTVPSGCKVYGPGLGDMNDLLDIKVLLEEH